MMSQWRLTHRMTLIADLLCFAHDDDDDDDDIEGMRVVTALGSCFKSEGVCR